LTASVGHVEARGSAHARAVLVDSALPIVLLATAVGLWALSLDEIDLRRVSNVGLISALPASFFAAVYLLTVSFGLTLASGRLVPLAPIHVVVQVLVLFGTPSFVEDGPRLQIAWSLAGIVDYITQNNAIDRGIDAFFNWPGFFVLVSFLTRAADLPDSLGLAQWAPLFFNLAYVPPLLLILRSLSLTDRQTWVALWLFFSGNWVGQDYLSPQAFAYFLYLAAIAIMLVNFAPRAGRKDDSDASLPSPRGRVVAVVVVVLLALVLAPSHQLTPWALVASIGALVVVRRLPLVGLPVLLAAIAATWVVFFAGPYLAGHFGTVASPIGSIGSNVESNLGQRLEGNAGHLFVVRARLAFSAGLVGLAVLGAVCLRRAGGRVRTVGALAFAPFLLVGVQNYGGEVVIRAYFFALPFLATAAAGAVAPLYAARRVLTTALATIGLLAIAGAFFVTRYGNERMDFFTKDELAAIRFAYDHSTPRSRLVAANGNLPWRFEHYADRNHRILDDEDVVAGSASEMLEEFDDEDVPSYLILTRSQTAAGELFNGWPPGTLERVWVALLRSGRFETVFANHDATVLEFIPSDGRRAARAAES
jgi:hypothetical protein